MISKHLAAWTSAEGSHEPSGQMGAVPETISRSPILTAREKPKAASKGDPDLARCLLIGPSLAPEYRRRHRFGSVQGVADEAASTKDLLRWGESLAAIARTGLGFTESLYERERFEEILRVAGEIRAAAASSLVRDGQPSTAGADDSEGLVQEWLRIVGSGVAGYVTPKIAVGAVVGNEAGQMLLVQRGDSGVWLYPTGWADVGYSAAEVAVKEVLEETGIEVEPVRLVMVLDGLRLGITQIPLYSLVFQLRPLGGSLQAHPLECRDVGWFAEDALPAPLAGSGVWKEHAFKAIRGEPVDVLFERPRTPVWKANRDED
jgi:ADP-ribose pyrophosphatase YjhB (NUDIX family)